MNKIYLSLFASLIAVISMAQSRQDLIAGPLVGHTELRTAKIWCQFSASILSATLYFREKNSDRKLIPVKTQLKGGDFNTTLFTLTALEPGKTYFYYVSLRDEKKFIDSGEVTTQSLWQWRAPAPDFSFLTGSCAYFNEPDYDRPGKPYGSDSSIFKTMAKEKSAFMLWLGDNWYTREGDYYSDWGLYYRASRDHSLPVLHDLFKAMPQYAIWDDHDYGPNDADKSYVLKNTSRNVFKSFWANPSYGMNEQGVYSEFTWNDVDVFLLDDRWYRSDDKLPDSVNGAPDPNKKMLGDTQMEWLKNALIFSSINSNISFRIIALGSQVLNPLSPFDCFRHYPIEYYELLKFIADNKINGVLFISGDRHRTEIIKTERSNGYPLYDITVSPFTSGIGKTRDAELNNPFRVGKETDAQNYARFSFSGIKKERKLMVDILGLHGEQLDNWSVTLKDLSY